MSNRLLVGAALILIATTGAADINSGVSEENRQRIQEQLGGKTPSEQDLPPVTGRVTITDAGDDTVVVNDQTFVMASTVKFDGVMLPADTAIEQASNKAQVTLHRSYDKDNREPFVTRIESSGSNLNPTE